MKYAELIEQLKPYADKEVFVEGYDIRIGEEIEFSADGKTFLTISRRYGKDEMTFGRIQ